MDRKVWWSAVYSPWDRKELDTTERLTFSLSPSIIRLLLMAVAAAAAKSLQSGLTLCDPIDGSLPGSPVPGILQARTLEWGSIAFSVIAVEAM